MSRENVEVVRGIYALGLDPEVLDQAFDEYLSNDFELRPPADYPDAEIYRGFAGIRAGER